MSWREKMKQAFAVDAPGATQPSEDQARVIDAVCHQIVRRGLTTPALMALEMSRPLNFIGSQAMHFFQPFVAAVTDARSYEHFASFLEHRGSVEHICRRIEAMEAEASAAAGSKPHATSNANHDPN